MAEQHCSIKGSVETMAPDEVVKQCFMGCEEAVCCTNTGGGEKYERCLAQLRKRLGEDPEPGDKCGSCGISW